MFACQPKAMEAMAMLRLMSGSDLHVEREASMVDMLASHISEDGIYWRAIGAGKPWLGADEWRPLANVHGQARMIRAMTAWYQYTGDPAWQERIDRMVDGLDRYMVVHRDDYGYFPVHGWIEEEYFRSCYVKGKGWKDTSEPADEKSGEEGSLFNHQGHTAGALANWYVLTGNEQALRLAGELVRFLMKPKFWADWPGANFAGGIGAEHAHWQGHYTGYVNVLRAILEYAVAAHDEQLKLFAREGYEWARKVLFGRIGFVGGCCGHGRLLGLAVKLTYAGIGDYWEDVDLYIRNHTSAMQFTPADLPALRRMASDAATDEDAFAEAMVGGFGHICHKDSFALCCSPHGNMALFYAWDGALQHSDGLVRVNLLLNRASPWMDVESCLPYEGAVVLRNKTASECFVRIPLWVDHDAVRCEASGRAVRNVWDGNYLRLSGLTPEAVVSIRFPMRERTENWTNPTGWGAPSAPVGTAFQFRFRGNTLVEVSPPFVPDDPNPAYGGHAEQYHSGGVPTTKVTRFVTDHVCNW